MRILLATGAALSLLTAGPTLAAQETPPPPAPPTAEWRTPDAADLLVIDTTGGRILVEMAPEIAPAHVERIKLLAGRGFYDGLAWHRVIDWFMAQTGDPLGTGEGQSWHPDLKAEFSDVTFGAGTVGMARSADPDSANSQFFIDLAPANFLDGQYTVVGQLIEGWDVLNAIKKGDQAANGAVEKPDYMSKVTIAP